MARTNYAFGDLFTTTRASEASYINSAGLLTWFLSNQPRIGDRGLLVEEQRANLLFRSEEFDNAGSWGKVNATITANSVVAPDGTTTADKHVETTTATVERYIRQTPTGIAAGSTVTCSAFVKAGTGSQRWAQLRVLDAASTGDGGFARFDLATGTISIAATAFGAGTSLSAGIERVGTAGWYRIWLVVKPNGTMTSAICDLFMCGAATGTTTTYTGDGVSHLYWWGAQLEVGAFPTSYIRTTSAAATRVAEVIAAPTGAWFNPSELSMFAEFIVPYDSAIAAWPGIARISNATDKLGVYHNLVSDTTRAHVSTGGVNQGEPGTSNIYTYGNVRRVAAAFKSNDVAVSADGAAVATDTVVTFPTNLDTLRLGVIDSYLNGYVRKLVIYPRRLGDLHLQRLST